MNHFNVILCIPTYNAESYLSKWNDVHLRCLLGKKSLLIIDSSSTDNTTELVKKLGFDIYSISKSEFNHGKTRNIACEIASKSIDILVFMTQDAILASPNSLEELIKPFDDPDVAAVCGRQLPHKNATPLAAHARLFNYPNKSQTKSKQDIPTLGIKCAFMSNSFAAYRRDVFEKLGGFPEDVILAEDMHLAARMILAGYKVAYCAESTVYHSHNYSLIEEFKRYFDTGVFQKNEPWIQENFGKASSEGKRFVISELKYILLNAPYLLPKAILSTFFKWLGFKLGTQWQKLPISLCKKFSMHKNYWKDK